MTQHGKNRTYTYRTLSTTLVGTLRVFSIIISQCISSGGWESGVKFCHCFPDDAYKVSKFSNILCGIKYTVHNAVGRITVISGLCSYRIASRLGVTIHVINCEHFFRTDDAHLRPILKIYSGKSGTPENLPARRERSAKREGETNI